MTDVSFLMVFIEGILTFISPCILPMLPIYFVYLAGTTANDISSSAANRKLIINTLAFILGFTIVFTLLGASVTAVGTLLKENIGLLRKFSGVMIIAFGLHFVGLLKLDFLNREKRIHIEFKESKFASAILFGAVFSFGWTPCVGPFLGSVLLLAGTSETLGKGVLLLITYSLGLGIPFLMSAVLFDKLKDLFTAVRRYQRIINVISGIILIIMGILVFTGSIQYIGSLFY